jgi:hypothetical protein
MYDVYNESPETKNEVLIRGRYLMMACDIEFCLFNIIMYCSSDPNNHERAGQFKEMQMAGKINNTISDLKKYAPAYYLEFKDSFDGLEEFRIIRNDMSHGKGHFPFAPDFSLFQIITVTKDKFGIERIKFKDYNKDYIFRSMANFAKIIESLTYLWQRLKQEYNSSAGRLI